MFFSYAPLRFVPQQNVGSADNRESNLCVTLDLASSADKCTCNRLLAAIENVEKKIMSTLPAKDLVPLPRYDRQRNFSQESVVPAIPRNARVLLVDDDFRNRTVLRLVLKQNGFDVLEAYDGFEAVDLYQQHRESITVVLLDILMPGMDGPATLAALRGLNPDVCCCFMGANLGSSSTAALRQLGVAAIFSKPFVLREVVIALTDLAVRTSGALPAR